jgi:glycosyltransferase involved in cell wall biosynthesis
MNPEILSEAAKRILDNPVLRKEVIRKAARTAAEDYSPDRWIANFEKLIEECLKKDLS